MKRLVVVLTVAFMIATVMLVSGMSLAAAQPTKDPEPPSDGGPVCSDRWLREWYIWDDPEFGPWYYYWWFRYCQNPDGEWFRAYDSWEWWGAVE